jgi:hypothetical protein
MVGDKKELSKLKVENFLRQVMVIKSLPKSILGILGQTQIIALRF